MKQAWIFNDGGRAAAGFKGTTGDCVVRAIAIAADKPYREVYTELRCRIRKSGGNRRGEATPRDGVSRKVYEPYLFDLGAVWLPTMRVGQGCTVHLRAEELPRGPLVVALSRHLVAVIDGVVHDLYDCTRQGTRCVYGYYQMD